MMSLAMMYAGAALAPKMLTSGVADSVLAQYGLIDYYPSEKFVDFSRGNLQVYEKALGTELLATETHTGPWVAEVGTPRWFSYIRPDTLSAGEGTLDVSLEFKRRFCQRQLLHARYLPRTLSCTAMFNPYVTPGFPGVVFDSVDAGFAFGSYWLSPMTSVLRVRRRVWNSTMFACSTRQPVWRFPIPWNPCR